LTSVNQWLIVIVRHTSNHTDTTTMSTTMQALVFDGPAADTSTTRVAELPVPEPGPGQIAIDVHHAGVNFIDVMARRGDPGYAAQWPFVPGLEVAGTVRALGPDADRPAIGTRVAAFSGRGGLAEVAIVAAPLVVEVPDAVNFAQAAAAPGSLTTAELLVAHTARVRAGDTVLVHAAGGGVGQALAQRARRAGATTVAGTVGRPERVAAAQDAGYDWVLARGPELAAEIRERTGGGGADIVLDPQGTELLELDLEVIAPGGKIVLFGNVTGELAGLPATGRLYAANASIAGFSLTRWSAAAPQRVAGALERVLADLASGAHSLAVAELEGLGAAADAQQALAEGRGPGKQVVRIG
jgi:NADPH2:quinone reductase